MLYVLCPVTGNNSCYIKVSFLLISGSNLIFDENFVGSLKTSWLTRTGEFPFQGLKSLLFLFLELCVLFN